jgi:hypothetical protein
MNQATRTVNTILNVCIFGAATALLFVGWQTYGTSIAKASLTSAMTGKVVRIPGAPSPRSNRTVVLALSANCRFCSDGAPFYRRLADRASRRGEIRVVATLPQPVDEGRSYLRTLGLDSIEVSQSDPSSIGVVGTPTLLLLDEDSRVQAAWIGRLSSNEKKEAFRRIFEGTLP